MHERIRITGSLRLVTDLHIGSGNIEDIKSRVADAEEGSYHAVLLDHAGQAFIPASTLRGWLRQQARAHGQAGHQAIKVFERSAFGYSDNDTRAAGRIRIQDANLRAIAALAAGTPKSLNTQRTTVLRHGIALEARTGVVDARKLFHYEVVPASSQFNCCLEMDRCEPEELPLLLTLLEGWDGSQSAAIGGDAGMGQGRLQWVLEKVESMTSESILAWLQGKTATAWQVMQSPPVAATAVVPVCRLGFGLDAIGGLLIHDPDWIQESANPNDHPPKQVYARWLDGTARVPGRSLRGLIRARARRIAATLLHQYGVSAEKANQQAEQLITALFGSEQQAGRLLISDARPHTHQATHIRPSIAIDRFTGSVKGGTKGADDGALWSAEVIEQVEWRGDVQLDIKRLPEGEWWKGLLLFVVRDAIEGDLAIGSGKSKGLGQFLLKLYLPDGTCISSWPALQDYLHEQECTTRSWVESLHDYLRTAAQPAVEQATS